MSATLKNQPPSKPELWLVRAASRLRKRHCVVVKNQGFIVIIPISPTDFRASNRDVNVRVHPRNESFVREWRGSCRQTSPQHIAKLTPTVQSEVSDDRFLGT
jgi:hypothetical protein